MAAVFTLTDHDHRHPPRLSFPAGCPWLGYLVGLVLLLLVSRVAWSELAFPFWVLIVGCYLIVAHGRFPMISGKMPTS